jgi:hypothetical protein
MHFIKVGLGISVATAAATVVLGLGAGSVSARTAPADCDKNSYNLQAYTYYVKRGSRWKVYKYVWRISGGGNVTTHSNLELALTSDGRNAYTYTSKDNLVNDNRRYSHRNSTYVSVRKYTPTKYNATFDRTRKPDVSCGASTGDL